MGANDQVKMDDLQPAMRGRISVPTLLLMHITAGRSILTAQSKKTGGRYTLRFARPDADPMRKRPIWVSLYGGEGGYLNTDRDRRAWTFLGTIWPAAEGQPEAFTYRVSPKSPIAPVAIEHKTITWIAQHLPTHVDMLMEAADWWHEGVCGRCGRRLTVPASIDSGFGPDCIDRVGGARA